MAEYTDRELYGIIEEQGGDPDEFRRRAEQIVNSPESEGREDLPGRLTPATVLGEATRQGFAVVREKIKDFLFCVLRGVWTKPLPVAARDCASRLFVSGG